MSFVKAVESQQENYYNCDFPLSHLYKFSWVKIRQNAPDVFQVLSNMHFDKGSFSNLLYQHQVGGGNLSSEKVACGWLRQNRDVWESWLPLGTFRKSPVYIGGMFPLSVSDSAVWSRPGILQGEIFQQNFRHTNFTQTKYIKITKNCLLISCMPDHMCFLLCIIA